MNIEQFILEHTQASQIKNKEHIQTLWSGYGEIYRVYLKESSYDSIVVKHIDLKENTEHPRGWNTSVSHQRKLKSYQVEKSWYEGLAKDLPDTCKIPQLIASKTQGAEMLLLMEDLNASGYPKRKNSITLEQIQLGLTWLAKFHAHNLNKTDASLWSVGTYWHLKTRPDEWSSMENQLLKKHASAIDEKLNACRYQTIVHGDAKLANFCFSEDLKSIAAVDFQYIGRGCGMKDVAYFLSSCLDEEACAEYEEILLDHYFKQLEVVLSECVQNTVLQEVIHEWKGLYKYAWADFYRFLDGWSPGHYKMHNYSLKLTNQVIEEIEDEA